MDGLLGGKTGRAVQAFQKWYPEASLMPSGRLDAGTLAALEDAAASGRAAPQASAAPTTTARTTPAPAPAPATTVDLIGEVMDNFDRTMMERMFNSDPEGSATLRWSNPATGRAYVAKAGQVLRDSGAPCRIGTVETALEGQDKTYYYAVCRRGGRWAYRYVLDRPVSLTTQ